MKIQNLFLTLIAAAAIMVGCNPKEEEQPSLPVLNVGQTEISFEQGGGTASVTVTSNRPWTITSDADWLAFNPSNGTSSSAPVNVTVTALANSSTDRNASFRVKTDFDYKTVNVTQKGSKGEDPNQTATGSGTASDPYNVYATIQKANSLVAYNSGDLTSENSANVYTKGKVVSVEIDPSYGNATYYISADGTATTQLEVYRGKYLNGANFLTKDQLKVGDEVVVYGPIVNFKGNTPEFTTGSKIISINGSSEAPVIDFTKFELITVKAFIDKKDNGQFFRLKGKVSKFNKQYCSFDLTDDSGTIYVYSVNNKDEWSEKISNGGTVELAGLYTYYEKNDQHEVVSAQILSFEAGSGGGEGDPKGSGTLSDPYNPAGAAAAVKNLTWTDKDNYQTTDNVYVKGKICKIADKGSFTDGGTYGNASFYISEDGEGDGEFYIYRTLYLGNKKYESGQTDIKVGDEVIIYGKLMNYRGNTPETEAGNCYLYSLNGQSGEGDQPGGDTEEVKTATIAEFIAAPDSKTQPYKLTGKVSNIKSDVYGNFDLTDASGTVYVYGLVSKDLGGYDQNKNKNDKSFASIGIKEGDEITIIGYRETYTPSSGDPVIEVTGSYYVSGASGGGTTPGGDTEEVKTATIAEFIAAPDSKTQPYKLTGKVSNIKSDVYGNFDLTDASGTVYVYGLVSKDLGGYDQNKNKNDKSFASIGIKEGDEITIIGYRETYTPSSGDPVIEVTGSYYVSGASGGGSQGGGGDEVSGNTIVFSTLNIESGKQYNGSGDDKTIVKATDFTVFFGKGANDGKYYTTGNGIRIYGNGYVRIESEKTITKVIYTFQKDSGTSGDVKYVTYPIVTDFTVNSGSLAVNGEVATWTGSEKTILVTRNSGNGHWRLQKVEVTFAQ